MLGSSFDNSSGCRGPRAAAGRLIAGGLAAALAILAPQGLQATETEPIRIAVFDFELDDRSAGRGITAADAIDLESLAKSTAEARRLISASGRYSVVDTGSAAAALTAAGGILHCGGCESSLAAELGADQSMVGLLTRVARTEYTLQVLIRDARSGAVVSNDFSGLRTGANYSWPRGVKWLMNNRILSPQRDK